MSRGPSPQDKYRLGVDIGGTFTDIVLVASDGAYWTHKVASTPDDYARGIVEGVRQLLGQKDLPAGSLHEISHGTTIASNAVLEGKGARTVLITTRGFRDVLELRRLRVPHLYSMLYEPLPPLVERRLRLEVSERVGARGEVVLPLDEASIESAVERIRQDDVEAVAVCLLHSFRNPAHERRIGQVLREQGLDAFISLSVDVLPEVREYERTSTTVVNAYLGPIVKAYVESLLRQLRDTGVEAPLRMMQSNGGVMSAEKAALTPVQILESGPAAGVVAAHQAGKRMGLDNLITFDMGGTTAKASLIENGERTWTTEYEVGAGVSLSSRLVKGGGHAVKVPVLDLAEVGAGGGSIAWIDRGGALKVGPHSAGAMPGPVCYDLGGREPTVTDANLVLGYINPGQLAGGAVKLKPELAAAELKRKIAGPLGLDLLKAAYGVHTVANASMMRAIRAVSTYRGRDPRDFALLAFGGSGPVHAAQLARSMDIRRVVVPPAPGLFSAVGLLQAQPEQHFVQTFFSPVASLDLAAINGAFVALKSQAMGGLAIDAQDASDIAWTKYVDLRYEGQGYELTIEAPARSLGTDKVAALVEGFHEEHQRTYGHRAVDEPVEVVNLRMTARSTTEESRPTLLSSTAHPASQAQRDAYFGPDHGVVATSVVDRSSLETKARPGPLIVEEYDATIVVPPDCAARLDEWGNVAIEVGPSR